MQYFDVACVLLSLAIACYSDNKNRRICWTLYWWFLISHAVYTNLLLDLRAEHNWLIYQMYNAINILSIYCLKSLNAHIGIILLMAVNILLNCFVSIYFAYDFVEIIVYNMYVYPASAIMISVLIYMIMVTIRGSFGCSYYNKGLIARILCLRYGDFKRLCFGGAL